MNCGRVSNQLSAYVDRELTGAEMLSIRSHLGTCGSCRAEYEALCRLKTMLGRLRAPEPCPDFVTASVLRLQRQRAAGRRGVERRGLSAPGCEGGFLLACIDRIRGTIWSGRAPRLFSLVAPPWRSPDLPILKASAVRQWAGAISWPRLTVGFTTAALATALLFTTVGWRRPRHPDALFATIHEVALGQDLQGQEQLGSPALDYSLVSNGEAGHYTHSDLYPGGVPASQWRLPWAPVTFESEGYPHLR